MATKIFVKLPANNLNQSVDFFTIWTATLGN